MYANLRGHLGFFLPLLLAFSPYDEASDAVNLSGVRLKERENY